MTPTGDFGAYSLPDLYQSSVNLTRLGLNEAAVPALKLLQQWESRSILVGGRRAWNQWNGPIGSMLMATNTISNIPGAIAWGFSTIQSHWFDLCGSKLVVRFLT
jgi:hypothetical protein